MCNTLSLAADIINLFLILKKPTTANQSNNQPTTQNYADCTLYYVDCSRNPSKPNAQ